MGFNVVFCSLVVLGGTPIKKLHSTAPVTLWNSLESVTAHCAL